MLSIQAPARAEYKRKEFYMYQNSDFYDSLFQINKQVRYLKSITKPIGADYLKHQQSFIRAAVGPTTLESTKFFPKFSQSVVGFITSSCQFIFYLTQFRVQNDNYRSSKNTSCFCHWSCPKCSLLFYASIRHFPVVARLWDYHRSNQFNTNTTKLCWIAIARWTYSWWFWL